MNRALESILAPVVQNLGFKWVGLQYFPQGRSSLLRVYIDKPGGITIEDCERVNRQANMVLGVEGVLKGNYTLEVSSPGLDRLLFSPEQCQEYLGRWVTIRLAVPYEGRRNYKGLLRNVEKDQIYVEVDQKELRLSFANIDEARLVPEW